ncbi:MAG: hypothetical protein LBT04_09935 [Prevotellaceae bacterium]|jgi:hypothetical protein|nr:hypothetical protein [Prevotellaceae bacterium]
MKSKKFFKMFMFCLSAAILLGSLGTVSANFFAGFSPPDVSHIVGNVAPAVSMSAIGVATLAAAPKDIAEKVKDYFVRYPNSSEVYENGGVLFHERGYADSYGKTETKKYLRDELEARVITAFPPIAEIDLGTLSYDQLKAYVKELGIKPADNKQATFLAALEEYKHKL